MILVVESNSQFCKEIGLLYKDSNQKVIDISDTSQLDEAVESYLPDVIVFGSSIPIKMAIDKAANLSISHSDIAVVIIVKSLDPNMLRAAMRAGIKDVIEQSSTREQVMASISRALIISKKLKESHGLKMEISNNDKEQTFGKIISFFSTKGGVGKSFISINSVVALAKITDKRVVILDLDLQFGDVAIMFQVMPRHTIYDVAKMIDRLDEDMLQGFLTEHSSGIKALLAPVRPHESDSITSSHINSIIDRLREHFDYVIIDTPPTFSEIVLTALDKSDLIYLIATMDLPSIKNTKLAMQTLKQLGYPNESIKLVLNRADSKVWLEIEEVEKSIGVRTEARIPSTRDVPRSINKGSPIVIEQPKSPVAKSLFDLVDKIKNLETKPVIQLSAAGQKSKTVRRSA